MKEGANKKIIIGLGIVGAFIAGIFAWKADKISFQNNAPISDQGSRESHEESSGSGEMKFPKDEGSHENALLESWYFKSHLRSSQNPQDIFGLTWVHIKNGLNVLFLMDAKNKKKYTINFPGPFAYDNSKLSLVSVNGFWTEREKFNYEVSYAAENIDVHLDLNSKKDPMVIAADQQSFLGAYLVQPRVDVSGSIAIGEKKYDLEGVGWIDHQYFSSGSGNILASSAWWKWWAIQLDNNTELLAFDVASKTKGVSYEKAFYIFDKDSAGTSFKKISEKDYTLESSAFWQDKKTRDEFPVAWRLEVPSENISLKIKAIQDDQLLENLPIYEGTCAVSGIFQGEKTAGWAQFENVIKRPKE